MEPIIAKIERSLIHKELNDQTFFKKTKRGDNELYIINNVVAPNTMLELGRLREITFRLAGGGTGKSYDLDSFDLADNPYQQLIVWDPKKEDILGGYRYICGWDINTTDLATGELFQFSKEFIDDYLPYTIELGRSFVQPEYQNTRYNPKSLYALDNLWEGLGGLVVQYSKRTKYLFGKVTMFSSYNVEARNILLYFLYRFLGDKEKLVIPIAPMPISWNQIQYERLFNKETYDENYKILISSLKHYGETIPPLIHSYMNVSPTMKVFGTAINRTFGAVEETGILVTIKDVYPDKAKRYLQAKKIKASIFSFLHKRKRRRKPTMTSF